MFKTKITAEPGKQEIIFSREFDAPRELVYRLWTDPRYVPEWWGPADLTTTVDSMDVRKGGIWRFVQRDAQGNEFAFNGVFHEASFPERIVQTTEFEGMPGVGLETITFEEMLEMASLGSKVLQIRSVEFAGKYKVRLRVLSSFQDEGEGTLITFEEDEKMEKAVISGIAFNRDEAKITVTGVPDRPGIAYAILGPIADANIDVDMIIQTASVDGKTDFSFTVHRNDFAKAMEIARKVQAHIGAKDIVGDDKVCKVSVVGVGMRSHVGIASKMFRTLAEEGINIQMISTSEIKISVVVDEKYLELAVRVLHKAFGLEEETA